MASETHVNDGGVWRKAISLHVNDSGTWRSILQAYVNDGGTWRTVFILGVEDFTVVPGTDAGFVGYSFNFVSPIGTIAPTNRVLPDGKTVNIAGDVSGTTAQLSIGGFSSDPSQSYLDTVTMNSVAKAAGSASSYSYDGGFGIAQWQWSGTFGLSDGVSCSLNVNLT